MAMFDFTITDQDVGKVIGPPDSFLVSLTLTTPPPRYQIPSGEDGSGMWKDGYISLKGERDHQAVFCHSPGQCGLVSRSLVGNASLAYRGGLKIQSMPKGAVYSLTLSDQPNVRPAAW